MLPASCHDQSLNKAPRPNVTRFILLNAGFGMGGQRYENPLEKWGPNRVNFNMGKTRVYLQNMPEKHRW